jgi:excisionase family DNA binding protein
VDQLTEALRAAISEEVARQLGDLRTQLRDHRRTQAIRDRDGGADVGDVKPRALVTPEEAARYLSIRPQTLANWRSNGTGPAYIKLGRLVRHPQAELDLWMGAQGNGAI